MDEVPFEAGHLLMMPLQSAQAGSVAALMEKGADVLSEYGFATTLLAKRGIPIFCGGWINIHADRSLSWSVISAEIGGNRLVAAFRLAKRRLAECPSRRIETTVAVGHKAAHRWCKMLGFEEEGFMRYYEPGGLDVVMYSIIREGG